MSVTENTPLAVREPHDCDLETEMVLEPWVLQISRILTRFMIDIIIYFD